MFQELIIEQFLGEFKKMYLLLNKNSISTGVYIVSAFAHFSFPFFSSSPPPLWSVCLKVLIGS